MIKFTRLETIKNLSKRDPMWVHKDIFRLLRKKELWWLAYENLKGNKGALTPGSTPETLDGTSKESLHALQVRVCSEQYKFKPVKLVKIPRPDGRLRPLGLPTANDKLVQEVLRLLLEAIYEPSFSEVSFGFRAGMGCHDALNHIENRFRWVDWVIEGDIQQAYPTIDHTTLIQLVERRVDDVRFIRLIWKLLSCGVLEEERMTWSNTGVPQGSIVSPILANIYFHELDKFVATLQSKYGTPDDQKNRIRSKEYKTLEHKIARKKKLMDEFPIQSNERQLLGKELKQLRKERFIIPSLRDKCIRIEYVRYADDWMIGIAGDRRLAVDIMKQVENFMSTTLKQTLHPDKTKITNIRKGTVHFLGYDIFLPDSRPMSRVKGHGVTSLRRGNRQLRFDVPVRKLTKRYADRGYLKQTAKGVRPISKASMVCLEDHVIVCHYRSVWLGLSQYYSGCTNLGRLQYLHYLLHMSCAMTLAHRHRSSSTKIFAKHGKNLWVSIPGSDKSVVFPYRKTWKLNERRWYCGRRLDSPPVIYANRIARSALFLPCLICDSNDSPCEMHHVKHVRKQGYRYQGFHQQMALLNRKQVPLCKDCHKKVHAGHYHGPSLASLREKLRRTMNQ